MSNVNRNPAGALELLNLNLQGEFPRALGGQLSPVLEMQPYYLDGVGLRSVRDLDPGVLAVGAGPTVEIPAAQSWAIRSVAFNGLNQDGSTQYAVSIIANPGRNDGPEFTLAQGITQTVLANQYYRVGAVFPIPVILPTATTIRAVVSIIGGVPVLGMASLLDVFYYPLSLS